jgi:hypothetical protein
MADGTPKMVRSISKGDFVKSADGTIHEILCVLMTKINQVINMVHLAGNHTASPSEW